MTEDQLDYPKLMERAMRGVVRDALAHVAKHELSGEHHFYITFRTTDPGVEISKVLLAQHPTEMTIVLQYKYWDLTVDEASFGVALSFGGMRQHLHIPFTSITSFVDPSVNFGFRLDAAAAAEGVDQATATAPAATPDPVGAVEAQPEDPAPDASAQVVTLDSFRKK